MLIQGAMVVLTHKHIIIIISIDYINVFTILTKIKLMSKLHGDSKVAFSPMRYIATVTVYCVHKYVQLCFYVMKLLCCLLLHKTLRGEGGGGEDRYVISSSAALTPQLLGPEEGVGTEFEKEGAHSALS